MVVPFYEQRNPREEGGKVNFGSVEVWNIQVVIPSKKMDIQFWSLGLVKGAISLIHINTQNSLEKKFGNLHHPMAIKNFFISN